MSNPIYKNGQWAGFDLRAHFANPYSRAKNAVYILKQLREVKGIVSHDM